MPAAERPPLAYCARHSGRAATYRCDECDSALCDDCVEQGHRLWFCAVCRGRAWAIGDHPSVTTERLLQQARHAQRLPLHRSLLYPFLGLGGYGFWGFLLLWMPISWLAAIPGLGLGAGCLKLLLLCLVPGLVLQVVRTTYDGADQLPSWPDLGELSERLGETLVGLLAMVIGLVPAAVALDTAGCSELAATGADWPLACQLVLTVGFWAAAAWWTGAVGAIALFDNPWHLVRFRLHVALLRATFPGCLVVATAITALFALANLAYGALDAVPTAGPLLSTALAIYTVLVAPHWIGLLYRRHLPAVERVWNELAREERPPPV